MNVNQQESNSKEDEELTKDEEEDQQQSMNKLAAYEFALRTKYSNNKREFLLDFCKESFDVQSEISESENKEDHVALRSEYKSLKQQIKLKKLVALNQQSNEAYEEEKELINAGADHDNSGGNDSSLNLLNVNGNLTVP